MEQEQKQYTPAEYFDYLKDKKNKITDEDLKAYYETAMTLVNKYKTTKQYKALKKLIFHVETIEKERELVKLGIDTFVYRDEVELFIEKVADKVVKIIELRNYEREIPDEIVEVIEATSDLFDELYVVFTDYTGEVEKQVEQERREKDPILFGTFQDKESRTVIDRFYFLGDWEDEFCDLTLDKMIGQMEAKGIHVKRTVQTPTDLEELKADLARLDENNRVRAIRPNQTETKPGFFKKVRSIFSGKNA